MRHTRMDPAIQLGIMQTTKSSLWDSRTRDPPLAERALYQLS